MKRDGFFASEFESMHRLQALDKLLARFLLIISGCSLFPRVAPLYSNHCAGASYVSMCMLVYPS